MTAFGAQFLATIFMIGAIDVLRHDAVTAATPTYSSRLDALCNMIVLVVGGVAFCFLVGVS